MTARIADLAGFGDRFALPRDKLGKAIGPAGRDPMGRRRVDHTGAVRAHRIDETRRLFRRLVRQAKDDDIDFAVELLLGGRVLARFGRKAHEFQAGDARELLPDLQAGGARLAVDEDCR